jgi:glucose-6-phosphate isomerase
MPKSTNIPFSFEIVLGEDVVLSEYDNHITRRLSAMKGQFLDQEAYNAMLAEEDTVLYEVYEVKRPEVTGELLQGLTIIHPGQVGDEYFMTKGHFHSVLETAEIYYCLQGEGYMVMETPDGEWAFELLRPSSVLYVPPRWAHRSVNTDSSEDLIMFFVYPGDAGHDYGSIEKQGFRKLVVNQEGRVTIIDNPRWLPPGKR